MSRLRAFIYTLATVLFAITFLFGCGLLMIKLEGQKWLGQAGSIIFLIIFIFLLYGIYHSFRHDWE